MGRSDMGAVTLFARVITATNIQLARIMNWAVLLLFLLLLTDVIMRKVAGAPISWSHQASKLLSLSYHQDSLRQLFALFGFERLPYVLATNTQLLLN